jgi:hypothetical protein
MRPLIKQVGQGQLPQPHLQRQHPNQTEQFTADQVGLGKIKLTGNLQ